MDTPLISVIVPVYKVEAYLDRCVQSIVDQTYRNLEIILVDDGSPDNCGAMCDAWEEKDSRIKVIHQTNGGSAQARNMGMDNATGQYISFVDSDDYIHPEMYQYLFQLLSETGSDIAECGYQITEEDSFCWEEVAEEVHIFSTEEALRENICDRICRQLLWNKVYEQKTIGDVRMVEGKTVDDEFFTYRVLAKANKVAVGNQKMYAYRQQPESVMHQQYSIKWLDALEAKVLRLEFIKENFLVLAEKAQVDLLFSCLYQMQQCLRNLTGEEQNKVRIKILEIVKQERPHPKNPNLPVKQKLWFYLAQWNLEITAKLRNVLKIGL